MVDDVLCGKIIERSGLEKLASDFKGKIGVTQKDILIDPSTKKPVKTSFQGWIEIKGFKKITIEYKPSFEEKHPRKTLPVVMGIQRHEQLHRADKRLENLVKQGVVGSTGCPGNIRQHLGIFEEAYKVLRKKGFSQHDTHYMVNIFEDWIDNSLQSRISEGKEYFDSFMNFFYSEAGDVNDGFTDFFETYMKLQGMCMPVSATRMPRKHYKHSNEVREVLDSFLERSEIKTMTKKTSEYGKERIVRDKESILKYISSQNNWPKLARVFAEEFSKLMTPNYAMPVFGIGGENTQGIPLPTQEENEKNSEKNNENIDEGIYWDELEGGNEFDDLMKEEKNREEIAWEEYEEGNSRPCFMKYDETLSAVYSRMARRLNIQSDVGKRTLVMPLLWFDPKPAGEKPRHLTIKMSPEGKPYIASRNLSIDFEEEYFAGEEGFPETRFVYGDSSGSMTHAPDCTGCSNLSCKGSNRFIPWGNKSKYHYYCLATEGFIELLKQKKLHNKTIISGGDFSCVSRIRTGLEKTRRVLYTPQFGSTKMSVEAINKIFEGEGALVFTVSDGIVDNWSSVKDSFIEQAVKHYYFHLNIGPRTSMSQDLVNAGIPVYEVKGDTDLFDTVFYIGNEMYKPRKEKNYDNMRGKNE